MNTVVGRRLREHFAVRVCDGKPTVCKRTPTWTLLDEKDVGLHHVRFKYTETLFRRCNLFHTLLTSPYLFRAKRTFKRDNRLFRCSQDVECVHAIFRHMVFFFVLQKIRMSLGHMERSFVWINTGIHTS